MEGHKGDKEQDLQRKMNVLDEENDGVKWMWKTNHLGVGHHLQYLR